MNILNRPPTSLLIGGKDYKINTDYRVWLRISTIVDEMDFSTDNDDILQYNLDLFNEIQKCVFNKIIDEDISEIQTAIIKFAQGYPTQRNNSSNSSDYEGEQFYSFVYDINYIIIAIRNQTGIDLSFSRKENFHWWCFLLEFQTLEEHHLISKIIKYRQYDGDDKELLKLKHYWALPICLSKAEQQEIDELEALLNE